MRMDFWLIGLSMIGSAASACGPRVSVGDLQGPLDDGGGAAGAAGAAAATSGGAAGTAGASTSGGVGGTGGTPGGIDAGYEGGIESDADGGQPCPRDITFADGTTGGLALGPHNRAFLEPMVNDQPVTNYAMQVVFPGRTLMMPADFVSGAGGPMQAGPEAGAALYPWLGEISVLAPGCTPQPLAGKTVRVEMLWTLYGAIVQVPDHGIHLGSYRGGSPIFFADASLAYVEPAPDARPNPRTLNTLQPVVVTHTFDEAEVAGGLEGLYLRLYAIHRDGELATTLYLRSIKWQ